LTPRFSCGEPWTKTTRADPPGKPTGFWLGPDAATGKALLAQDAKVTPAANTAPTAAKREKLIRIEVLSSSVQVGVAKPKLRERVYPGAVSPHRGVSLPHGTEAHGPGG